MEGYYAGVDVGSTITKVVIHNETLVASVAKYTGADQRRKANEVMVEALDQAHIPLKDILYIVATGYGRLNVPFADEQVTEITCHGKGVSWLFPSVKVAIDVGGQDCKGIKLVNGRVMNFVMNDKCAAGTGRYLEVLAHTLGMGVDELGELSLHSRKRVAISSTCTIFAEQEVVSRLSEGVAMEDIAAGVHASIAERVYRMVQRLKIEPDVVFTGGGALNVGLVKALEEKPGLPMLIPPDPLLTGAIGAAIIAQERAKQAIEKGTPLQGENRRLEEVRFFT